VTGGTSAAVALRFALYLDLGLLFGLPLFGLFALHSDERRAAAVFAFRSWIAAMAATGLPLSAAALLVSVAAMADQPVTALDPALVRGLLFDTAIGLAYRVRGAALVVALVVGLLPRITPTLRLGILVLAGAVALASLAWTGHGAMDEGGAGWLHLGADIVHLLAAGLWTGALAALLLLVARDLTSADNRVLAVRALHGFSGIGTAMVAVLTVSGAVNIWSLLIRPGTPLLPLDGYRLLLLLKIVAFAAMLGLAGANRWLLTPRLADGRTGIRTSIAIEALLGLLILYLVAQLGTLSPSG
jgi:putative copper resistance protein D